MVYTIINNAFTIIRAAGPTIVPFLAPCALGVAILAAVFTLTRKVFAAYQGIIAAAETARAPAGQPNAFIDAEGERAQDTELEEEIKAKWGFDHQIHAYEQMRIKVQKELEETDLSSMTGPWRRD